MKQTILLDYEYNSPCPNIRQTSKRAYKEGCDNGLIHTQLSFILFLIKEYPVITMRELSELSAIPVHLVSARINELYKQNLIYNYNKRKCHISNKLALTWCLRNQEVIICQN